MSNVNDFVPFCNSNTGTNLPTQSAYLVNPDLPIGNQPGIASSSLNNKALRQGTTMAAVVAQFVVNQAGISMLDDQNSSDHAIPTALLGGFTSVFKYMAPVITTYTSGSGTHYLTFKVQCASANATAGATYSDGTTTFTVVNTISAGTEIWLTGAATNPVSSGTLTLVSGTGDSTITYYAVRAPIYARVRMAGGGGGGGGSYASGTPGTGGNGGNTTFGTSLLTCDGGTGGAYGGITGPGGSATIGSGATGLAFAGTRGATMVSASDGVLSGMGGINAFSGPGMPDWGNHGDAVANSGCGGAGGIGQPTVNPGDGGGAGGYIEAIITDPIGSYAYAVGSGGAGGAAGTSGSVGGAGAAGIIYLEEHYQ